MKGLAPLVGVAVLVVECHDLPHHLHSRFRVDGSAFWVRGFEFGAWGFEVWVVSSGCWDVGFGFGV